MPIYARARPNKNSNFSSNAVMVYLHPLEVQYNLIEIPVKTTSDQLLFAGLILDTSLRPGAGRSISSGCVLIFYRHHSPCNVPILSAAKSYILSFLFFETIKIVD